MFPDSLSLVNNHLENTARNLKDLTEGAAYFSVTLSLVSPSPFLSFSYHRSPLLNHI